LLDCLSVLLYHKMSAAILTRLSQSYRARKLMERQLFHDSNRREVLALYREVLKAVDRTIPRKLEKEAKLAVSPRFFGLLLYLRGLSFIFRNSNMPSERPSTRQTWIRSTRSKW